MLVSRRMARIKCTERKSNYKDILATAQSNKRINKIRPHQARFPIYVFVCLILCTMNALDMALYKINITIIITIRFCNEINNVRTRSNNRKH